MTRILFNHILHDQEKINSVTLFFGCQLFYSTGVTYVNSISALQIFMILTTDLIYCHDPLIFRYCPLHMPYRQMI